ncbi:hypothetical protein ABVT39_011397 [Epinephelus coioides]
MEDVNTLINMADTSRMVYPNGDHNLAWIGLYDDVNSWRWSLSDTSFYKDGEMEFRRWGNNQPDSYKSNEHCTVMYGDGLWNDVPCSYSLKVVCSYVRGSDVTFILITKSMTWTEAQSHCRVNYTDLTSVRNMTENQKVQELIPAGELVWIGLFRDSWKWSDGSSSSFRHWKQTEPNNVEWNEYCVAAHFGNSGQWEDWPCDVRRAFICYSRPTSQTTSSSTAGFSTPPHYLTTSSETQPESATSQTTSSSTAGFSTPPHYLTTSSETQPESAVGEKTKQQTTTKQVFRLKFHTQDPCLDPNDPAVMEDTLKKLKQKLKDQGLGDNIKLSWRKQPDGKVFHKEEKKKKKRKKTKKDEL